MISLPDIFDEAKSRSANKIVIRPHHYPELMAKGTYHAITHHPIITENHIAVLLMLLTHSSHREHFKNTGHLVTQFKYARSASWQIEAEKKGSETHIILSLLP